MADVFLGLPRPASHAYVQSAVMPGRHCNCRECSFYAGDDLDPRLVQEGRWDGPWCDGSNANCSYCGCARSDNPTVTGGCTNCSVRCSSRVDFAAWMADVGGTLTFDDIVFTQPDLDLPRFVPQSDGSAVSAFDQQVRMDAWAVGLRRVFSPVTWSVMPRFAEPGSARTAMGLRDGQRAVLVGYGTDPIVEAFWSRRVRDRLVEQIAAQGWDLVLAPNYSSYGNYPMSELLLNWRRNLLLAQEFADAGVACAPNLYWYRLRDLRRYRAWALDTEPKYLAVNLQTFRTTSDWNEFLLPGLTWLSLEMPDDIRWVFTTGGNVSRLREVSDLFGADRCTFITQKPWQTAAHGEVLNVAGKWVRSGARPVDSFATSARRLTGWLSGDVAWPHPDATDSFDDDADAVEETGPVGDDAVAG